LLALLSAQYLSAGHRQFLTQLPERSLVSGMLSDTHGAVVPGRGLQLHLIGQR
jgi:hypothetical protein